MSKRQRILLVCWLALLPWPLLAFLHRSRCHPLAWPPSPSSFVGRVHVSSGAPGERAVGLKKELLKCVEHLRKVQERDGSVSIDFGVKGGELNATSRAPQKIDYYAVSKDVGQAADAVTACCNELALVNPTVNATAFLGDRDNGQQAPLHGAWKLLFTSAADASFSKNSTRGAAKVQNIVNWPKGYITNVIDFLPRDEDGKAPLLQQLNVVIGAKACPQVASNSIFATPRRSLADFFSCLSNGACIYLFLLPSLHGVSSCFTVFFAADRRKRRPKRTLTCSISTMICAYTKREKTIYLCKLDPLGKRPRL